MSFACCFKCLTCFGCRDCIVNKFAFMPPTLPSYLLDITPEKYSDEACESSRRILLLDEKGGLRNIPTIDGLSYKAFLLKTSGNHYIPCIYVEYTKIKSDWVIIFSHGNSTDIGRMFESYMDLAYNLKVNVFGFEYPGYGKATGKPSEFSIISAEMAAYRFVNGKMKFSWSKIILYGQSVGSGPAIFLASIKLFPVSGMIIHSGISSGLRVYSSKSVSSFCLY